jgi:hypothetical protein
MPSIWFVVPADGRAELTRICLKQLRHVCDRLTENGVDANAVVVACDENLDTAAELGFATFARVNDPLSRKFNDGIALALDPRLNRRPADYVAMCGSDDWVDWRLFLDLPPSDAMLAFRQAAFVSEDGRRIVSRVIDYSGGVGIRVYPRRLLQPLRFRPADEHRERGCDTSIWLNVKRGNSVEPRIVYGDRHPWQIVDWKTHGKQLNRFDDVANRFHRGEPPADPFDTLADVYPADLLDEMRAHYEKVRRRGVIAVDEGGFSQYEVIRQTGYAGFPPGEVFEAVLDKAAEARALERGDIRVLQQTTTAIPAGSYRLPDGWIQNEEV